MESPIHGMTGITAGGFFIKNQSLGDYSVRLKALLFLSWYSKLLVSLNIGSFYNCNILSATAPWNCLISAQRYDCCRRRVMAITVDVRNGRWVVVVLFQTVSGFVTAGFNTVDLQDWRSPRWPYSLHDDHRRLKWRDNRGSKLTGYFYCAEESVGESNGCSV